MRAFLKSQFTYLVFGLIFWLPLVILLYILFFLFSNIESMGHSILLAALPDNFVHRGFGIALFIVIVYFTGIVLKLKRVRRFLSQIPVVGLFFGAGEMISIERLLHLRPCLFLYSPTCLSYGWILSEEKIRVGEEKANFTLVNVYYPNVPSLITGSVFPLRKDMVIKLGNSSKEVIDLLLYAFRSPADLKYLPWENEAREDFEKRAKFFGLKDIQAQTGSGLLIKEQPQR
jgi:uncharacterized membrane protein